MHVTKLMVVPYVPRVEEPQETKVLTLDEEMSSIINDPKLDVSEKVQLYNQTLLKYQDNLELYSNNDKIQQKNFIDVISSEVTDKVKNELKPQQIIKTEKTIIRPIIKKNIKKVLKKEKDEKLNYNNETLNDTLNQNLNESTFEKIIQKSEDEYEDVITDDEEDNTANETVIHNKKTNDVNFINENNSYYVGNDKSVK